ncbi:hypothetical protein FPG101_09165 [Flavobacterium psychrophilum FPG101]|uniref:hypothetical protein n=1 Tax=Flavobacterium psychrophilum TaxID=96345 RepID=UPI0004F84B71|nr:hypothetical protein [Flavobacterium psychrophilum]AIN72877.1 hypothetical protein FPG101_09165 [Flavobacterium psychrophilum FPG101]ELV7526208.1 hypothetical protein [Flavobacterium psychrophilum]OJH11749.1 hypothetical protein FPG103_08470 [Flavobacterium psychrophilum]OUD32600.1 hypothetical protein FPG10A_08645 [Flavobacterium psychrophilum]OUD36768.1 hypothetical protein FPG102_10410 [Flavobacterium psychrophilum]
MNTLSKRLDKFKSFYNNPNPFKNKADEFVFRFFGVSLIFVILRIIIDYFSKEYVIKGMYEYVAFAIVQLSIILACFFSLILPARFFSLILKNIFVKSQIKSLEPKINEREELDLESMTDEEKFISFFQDKSFNDFRNIAIENKIISESGKYIHSKTQRHLSVLIGKLFDNGIIIATTNRKDFCLVAKKYFQTNIDYSEMNTIINDCFNDELTSKNDKKAFEKLNIFDSIKI